MKNYLTLLLSIIALSLNAQLHYSLQYGKHIYTLRYTYQGEQTLVTIQGPKDTTPVRIGTIDQSFQFTSFDKYKVFIESGLAETDNETYTADNGEINKADNKAEEKYHEDLANSYAVFQKVPLQHQLDSLYDDINQVAGSIIAYNEAKAVYKKAPKDSTLSIKLLNDLNTQQETQNEKLADLKSQLTQIEFDNNDLRKFHTTLQQQYANVSNQLTEAALALPLSQEQKSILNALSSKLQSELQAYNYEIDKNGNAFRQIQTLLGTALAKSPDSTKAVREQIRIILNEALDSLQYTLRGNLKTVSTTLVDSIIQVLNSVNLNSETLISSQFGSYNRTLSLYTTLTNINAKNTSDLLKSISNVINEQANLIKQIDEANKGAQQGSKIEDDSDEIRVDKKALVNEIRVGAVGSLLTIEATITMDSSTQNLKLKYPISTRTNWGQMRMNGDFPTGLGGKMENYTFYIDDLIDFIPDSTSGKKYYHWQNFSLIKLRPGGSLKLIKKNWFTDALNLTAYYDAVAQIRAAQDNGSKSMPLQLELNLRAPLVDWNACKSTFWLPQIEANFNFTPASAKAGPYHVLDSATIYRTGNRSINFEFLRDHYMNFYIKPTLFRVVPTVKGSLVLDLPQIGFRGFVTNIKTRQLAYTENANKIDTIEGEDIAATSFIIGPELTFKGEYTYDEWFAMDFSLSTTYYRRAVGVKRNVENLLEDYGYPNGRGYNRQLWTLSPEINFYFRLPSKSKANPSGFTVRYRLYEDLLSAANPSHYFMIGYAANLKTLFK